MAMIFGAVFFFLCLDSFAFARSNQTCISYGVDFEGGGSYFQNASSSDPFTFVTRFEGRHTFLLCLLDGILADEPQGAKQISAETSSSMLKEYSTIATTPQRRQA